MPPAVDVTRFAAILPAAGVSRRFGSDKLLAPLRGMPVLGHTLLAFARRRDVRTIVLATDDTRYAALPPVLRQSLESDPRFRLCEGGDHRAETVRRALTCLSDDVAWVAVHDAARPLVSDALLNATFAAARTYGAAVPAVPIVETVKRVGDRLPARVIDTPGRDGLFRVQTPQIMRVADLRAAYDAYTGRLADVTDDAALLEAYGIPVWLVPGEQRNLKITRPLDLALADWWLDRPDERSVPPVE